MIRSCLTGSYEARVSGCGIFRRALPVRTGGFREPVSQGAFRRLMPDRVQGEVFGI